MTDSTMPPAARKALSATIRDLRARLLADFDQSLEQATQLSTPLADVSLTQLDLTRRARVEDHFARGATRAELVEEAAYTLLNRLVFLRLLEARGLVEAQVVTGGWASEGYLQWREYAAELVQGDPTEGYQALLDLVFAELALDLPGLFGAGGVVDLVPVRADTLRAAVEALDAPALGACWADPLLPGWIYQYFNDPAREDLDAKIADGGKIAPHEIASKTQMFTERYMVDWLLQNSLGPIWFAICAREGWTPEAADVIDGLEDLRAAWRAKRAAGAVEPDALMPLRTDAMRRWAYYVKQPLPADAVAHAPTSLKDLTLIDPACGSGHFLVVALPLLVALLEEEARHRGLSADPAWSRAALVEHVVGQCLHGVDLDPRAVQIAAASLWIEARRLAPAARPAAMHLVASRLRLARLPADAPARAALRAALAAEAGLPGVITDAIFDAVALADTQGSLLKIDDAVRQHLTGWERGLDGPPEQGDLFAAQLQAKERSILDTLEGFLARHTRSDDLGLRLGGEQLAAGVRFVRMLREGRYDLVVGNPPYQGTSKLADAGYVQAHYRLGKADLFAAFLIRGLELCRPGGTSALLTMRNWMFIKQYAELRQWLLETHDLRALGDFAVGAFDEVPNDVLSVVVSVFRKVPPAAEESVALRPTHPDEPQYDRQRTGRKRAATRCQVGRFDFEATALKVVPEWPLVYWWSSGFLARYDSAEKLGEQAPVRQGLATSDNKRYLRRPWEVSTSTWFPFVKGGEGRKWLEPLSDTIRWDSSGLMVKVMAANLYGSYTRTIKNEAFYLRPGVAFTMIGQTFEARAHTVPSVFDVVGSSAFPNDVDKLLCSLNRSESHYVLSALNPTIHFQVGDVNRLPVVEVQGYEDIMKVVRAAFTTHESHREPSVEFRRPGPSAWDAAQAWAQLAVDRPDGAPLPPWAPVFVDEEPWTHLSYALGVALGRFHPGGEGVLDPATADLSHALPRGILFVDGTQVDGTLAADAPASDGLGHPATALLRATWDRLGAEVAPKRDLRGYLQHEFFDAHRGMYENKPIHWPLSSADRTFVVWVTIHRMDADTLPAVLVDHLLPAQRRLDGRLADLAGPAKDDPQAAREHAQIEAWRAELAAFIAAVDGCARRGPPPPTPKVKARGEDAAFDPRLDDGVMINSAALWPLLAPQWKKPAEWWTELATAKGRKDYDWAHLAARYWPLRVDAKCRKDPSLAVAHGCFWRYHPAVAFKWELRLQDEIGAGPDGGPFRIDEADSDARRAAFIAAQPRQALEIILGEAERRLRGLKKDGDAAPRLDSLTILDAGLWTAAPDAVWQMELAMIKKQSPKPKRGQRAVGFDFRLLAPDEAAGRAAFEAAHPAAAAERRAWIEPEGLL